MNMRAFRYIYIIYIIGIVAVLAIAGCGRGTDEKELTHDEVRAINERVLEKAIKAYWCGTRDDDPPYIHDHNRLLEFCGLAEKMSDEQRDFIDMMKPMYIAARYPEHKQRVAATLNEQTCKDIVEQTKQFRQWILQEYSAATKPSSSFDATSK